MQLVSNFGDIAVLLPASLGLIVFLAWIGWRQDAAAYPAALAVCFTAALFGKLALAACIIGARGTLARSTPCGVAMNADSRRRVAAPCVGPTENVRYVVFRWPLLE
jgi:hypothetical protein